MPDDNPYAAPQSVLRPPVDASLPIAEAMPDALGRRLFPDWDTKPLLHLAERSLAINKMQKIWLVICFVMPFVGFVLILPFLHRNFDHPEIFSMIILGGTTLVIMRYWIGQYRTLLSRRISLSVDGLLAFVCLIGMIGFFYLMFGTRIEDNLFLFYGILVFCIVGHQGWQNWKILFQSPELFGPERLRDEDLIQEVEYRQQHGVL